MLLITNQALIVSRTHRVLIRRDDGKIDVVTGGATLYFDCFDLKRGR